MRKFNKVAKIQSECHRFIRRHHYHSDFIVIILRVAKNLQDKFINESMSDLLL